VGSARFEQARFQYSGDKGHKAEVSRSAAAAQANLSRQEDRKSWADEHAALLRPIILDDNISALRAEYMINSHHRCCGAAQSTVDALMYGPRPGISALSGNDPNVPHRLRRLSELNGEQLKDCCLKLQNKPEIGPKWDGEDILKLVALWRKLRV
jgi:hypothetical protein